MKRLGGILSVPLVLALVGSFFAADAMGAPSGYGKNLLLNGGAEANNGAMGAGSGPAPSSWRRSGTVEVIRYGAYGGFPDATAPGPTTNRGKNFFAGGYPTSPRNLIYQSLDLGWAASAVDASKATYTVSAYLGGYGSSVSDARVQVIFFNAAGKALAAKTIGPVTPQDRANVTGLFSRKFTGKVPRLARKARVSVIFTNIVVGNYDDAYADNISLVLKRLP